MLDIHEQLALLRRRVARIDRKYSEGPPRPISPPSPLRPARYGIEHYIQGEIVETPEGRHFESERLYPAAKRHGSVEIRDLSALPPDLLEAASGGITEQSQPHRWAFLDTETTGLAGGSGTYAFLIGVGRITEDGFRLRHFFMRDLGEESSLLRRLHEHLSGFELLITFNGKSYDLPLLETRYRMKRLKSCFSHLAHFDLLHSARRLWKLRFDSCRLTELEREILGVEREGDLPGELIPYVYFEYLRTREAERVVSILHHNAMDILTLACLMPIAPVAFQSAAEKGAVPALTHAAEMVALGRWLTRAGKIELALGLLRQALSKGLPDALLFQTLWNCAELHRKLKQMDEATCLLEELASCRNPHRVDAQEQLAKHYEHSRRDWAAALDWTLRALDFEERPSLLKRRERLLRRLAYRPSTQRLL